MKELTLNDIQLEYHEFLEYISYAHSLSEELVSVGNVFLSNYCKSLNCDKNFAEEFEINLLYLENCYQNISDLLEMTDNIYLSKLKMPISNIIRFEKRTEDSPSV